MIAAISRGSDVAGLGRYLHGPGRANEHVYAGRSGGAVIGGNLGADGERGPASWTSSMRAAMQARPDVAKAVWHMSLRTAPGDPVLSDAAWRDVAQGMGESMGWADRPWVVIRHAEDHVHVVVSRVGFDGSLWHARHDFRAAQRARVAIEAELGLTAAPTRSQDGAPPLTRGEVAAGLRTGAAPGREVLAARVSAVVEQARGLGRETFEAALTEAGVQARANVASTGRVSGYSFALDGHQDAAGAPVWFKGSALGRELSWSRLEPVLAAPAPAVEQAARQAQAQAVAQVPRKRLELPGRHQARVQAAAEAEVARRVAGMRRQAPRLAGREAGHASRQVRARWAQRAERSPRTLVSAQRAALAQVRKLHQAAFPTALKGQTLRQRMATLKAAQDAAPARVRTARNVARGPGRDPGGLGR
ncbi:relaxase/mobilization nuclease domain-containing protein [Kineococcus arenarius]|uniref:relaxase/mobilization nuclease domain-containing protein n=1 Tax=unclassified Kineococcus TaxID=2621656 RepID=UPI003D7E97C7